MFRAIPALGLVVAGCAAPAAVAPGPDHPASPQSAARPALVSLAALAPTPAPAVPLVLRPDRLPPAGGAAGHHGHAHGAGPDQETAATDAGGAPMLHAHHNSAVADASSDSLGDAPAASGPMARTLDAYLTVHDALAADRVDAEAARTFGAAFAELAETPPADDPHLWHARSAEVEAVHQSAAALGAAGDLDEARAAFAALSVPFAALVRAAGVPEGYGVELRRCGMFDGPEGGVWLQPEGETRNPYFGRSMPTCGTHTEGLEPETSHGGHR